ncbi:MAG: hypothetical protein ACRBCL_09170 [Maritimibacter sp.]
MPALLAILGILSAAAYLIIHTRNASNAAGDLLEVANDVRLAARRFGFRRNSNLHPVESIEDENTAIAALGVSFLELDTLPAREHQSALGRGLQNELRVSLSDSEELMVLGRWLMTECKGPETAVARLAKRLAKIGDEQSFTRLMGVIKEVSSVSGGLSDKQQTALSDIKRAFRIN